MRSVALWLCPAHLTSVDAGLLGGNADLVVLHQIDEVKEWLGRRDPNASVDAIVVDSSPAPAFDYEPAVIMQTLTEELPAPPRVLVVVVMRDLAEGRSPAFDALAVEMHRMWRGHPLLVVEEAVAYYVQNRLDRQSVKIPDDKASGLGQARMWPEIATRLGRHLGGSLALNRFVCPKRTSLLVEAMTAPPRAGVEVRYGREARRILIALAYRRLDRPALVKHLRYSLPTVNDSINRAARQIRSAAPEQNGNEQLSAFAYLGLLAERYGPWLRSLNDRHLLVGSRELPVD